jgi:7,8-dihydropterin-6-yl-methyl-4-(beta-D-ribofuranosyl)aminobenzene 5'-phosphate synthase
MIKITCLIEDKALPGTPFKAKHGIAWLIDTGSARVLFDTGPDPALLEHNAGLIDLDWAIIDAVVLSHAHLDHTGGLPAVIAHTRPAIPLYASPDIFRERYSRRAGCGMEIDRKALGDHFDLRLDDQPVEMVNGVWTTGEIVERSSFEGRSKWHEIQIDGKWLPDPYRDDLSVVVEAEAGLIVLCGCCHAGLLNTLNQVSRTFPDRDIIMVAGGTHLGSASAEMLAEAIDALRDDYGQPRLYPNHCTGPNAFRTLAGAFGEKVQPCPAGTVLTF